MASIYKENWMWKILNTLPFLCDRTDYVSGWCRNFHSLQTTRETATGTGQRTIQMDHFVLINVHYFHIEWTGGTTTITCAAIGIFDSPIYLKPIERNWKTYSVNSNAASLTFCPKLFLIVNLLFVSNPTNASSSSTFCFTNSWSIVVRYSNPGGQFGIPSGIFIHPSEIEEVSQDKSVRPHLVFDHW